jgi:hypothetical protein
MMHLARKHNLKHLNLRNSVQEGAGVLGQRMEGRDAVNYGVEGKKRPIRREGD